MFEWLSYKNQEKYERVHRHSLSEGIVEDVLNRGSNKSTFWKPFTPMHLREAAYTGWQKWFAWYPVKTEQDEWCFLRYTYYRYAFLPVWFSRSINCDYIVQYSHNKKGESEL